MGILPNRCSTPSIQDAQSSQSSTIPAFVICSSAKHAEALKLGMERISRAHLGVPIRQHSAAFEAFITTGLSCNM